ncbi:MAG TPA: hypothetical protein VG013_37860 [Gemmataceae bacterium]|nr:hypothetical protein [Gemmataceae bacterium]
MDRREAGRRRRVVGASALLIGLAVLGCHAFMRGLSDHLSKWNMLGEEALADPIQAVGGDGVVFVPGQEDEPLGRRQLAAAQAETLISYYAPIFVQQRINSRAQPHPYPPEYDMIGTAHLHRQSNGKLKSYVGGSPTVYAIFKKLPIDGHEHVQLTYTAWYPGHPRMKAIDLEAADIDSCVLRVTLDAGNVPLFYETIAACGCFHKVFVQRWIEEAARTTYGPPEKDKNYSVERSLSDGIDWEVAGVVDEPRDQPRRPVVFLKAGEHKVIGLGTAARLRVPPTAEAHPYEMVSYAQLYAIQVDGSGEQAPFFDMEHGGKVRGAERRHEKFLLSFVGVDAAGQPRADDQIKMHFDQSTWGDPTIYGRFLRLPPGTL